MRTSSPCGGGSPRATLMRITPSFARAMVAAYRVPPAMSAPFREVLHVPLRAVLELLAVRAVPHVDDFDVAAVLRLLADADVDAAVFLVADDGCDDHCSLSFGKALSGQS